MSGTEIDTEWIFTGVESGCSPEVRLNFTSDFDGFVKLVCILSQIEEFYSICY